MKTTALFVELLIIGAMTCIWIVLFLMKDFNELDFANLVVFVKSNKYLVTAVAVPVVYTVGIVFDKLAKYIFQIIGSFYDRKPVGRNLKKHLCEKYGKFYCVIEPFTADRLQSQRDVAKYADVVINAGDPMIDLLYGRTKVRILRSLVIFLPMTAWAFSVLLDNAVEKKIGLGIRIYELVHGVSGIWIAGLILFLLCLWLYLYNAHLYRVRLNSFHLSYLKK